MARFVVTDKLDKEWHGLLSRISWIRNGTHSMERFQKD